MYMNKITFTTEKRRVNDLVPYEHNPRRMTDKQVKDLTKSLEKFGLVEIPVVNKDNTLLAGHQRMKIMQLLGRGDEEIDVRVPNRQLNDKEAQEYNIRSNKNTGDWDFDLLANAFEQSDLLDWGFSDRELDNVGFSELNDVSDTEDSERTDLAYKYELIFETEEEFKLFNKLLKEIAIDGIPMSSRLLDFLKHNVK